MLRRSKEAVIGACVFTITACMASPFGHDMETSASKPAIMLDAGEGDAIGFPLHPTTRLVFADSNEAGLSLFEISIPAGTAGAPPHSHTSEDEFFYVREGRVTFLADEQQKTISAGGLVLLPRGGWHALWNADDSDAVLLVGTSAGRFDDFFDSVAMEAASAGELTPPEIGAIVARVGAERGIEIDMARVPEDVRPIYGLPPLD